MLLSADETVLSPFFIILIYQVGKHIQLVSCCDRVYPAHLIHLRMHFHMSRIATLILHCVTQIQDVQRPLHHDSSSPTLRGVSICLFYTVYKNCVVSKGGRSY